MNSEFPPAPGSFYFVLFVGSHLTPHIIRRVRHFPAPAQINPNSTWSELALKDDPNAGADSG